VAIGLQLISPNGHGALKKNCRYYFLRNDECTGLVTLVSFRRDAREWRVFLDHLPRDQFEADLASQNLVQATPQHTMPPWLLLVDGINFDQIDTRRGAAKRSYRQKVEGRFSHIAPLLSHIDDILSAPKPLSVIAAHAPTCSPAQHPHRLQLWLLSYLLFGNNIWSLMSPTHMCGNWDRDAVKHQGIKRGRHSLSKGSNHGYPSAPLIDLIIKGYLKYCGIKVTMRSIYRDSMRDKGIFGCKTRHSGHICEFFHPEGKPFPTYGEFRYRVVEWFGLEQVQRTIYGQARVRQSAQEIGSFSESYGSLLEAIEVDAFYIPERPRSMFSDDPMPPLCVARSTDIASGEVCGVGFALGSEKSEAYSTMLFSMAVGKKKVCALFGVDIESDEWVAQGLSGNYISDRGPGASRQIVEELQQKFPIMEIAPSWSPQAKPTTESSHPRAVQTLGEPTFVLSKLNVMQMARREILRCVKDNHASDASPRMTPSMITEFVNGDIPPTPHNVWKYLDGRMRTSAVSMSFDEAVRSFLKPISFDLTRDGVFLGKRRFHSERLIERNVFKRVTSGQSVRLDGYVLALCVRHAWVEVDGELIELEAKLRLRNGEEELYVPLSQLQAHADEAAALQSLQRKHALASEASYADKLKDQTGVDWDAGDLRRGRAKRRIGDPLIDGESKVIAGRRKKVTG